MRITLTATSCVARRAGFRAGVAAGRGDRPAAGARAGRVGERPPRPCKPQWRFRRATAARTPRRRAAGPARAPGAPRERSLARDRRLGRAAEPCLQRLKPAQPKARLPHLVIILAHVHDGVAARRHHVAYEQLRPGGARTAASAARTRWRSAHASPITSAEVKPLSAAPVQLKLGNSARQVHPASPCGGRAVRHGRAAALAPLKKRQGTLSSSAPQPQKAPCRAGGGTRTRRWSRVDTAQEGAKAAAWRRCTGARAVGRKLDLPAACKVAESRMQRRERHKAPEATQAACLTRHSELPAT